MGKDISVADVKAHFAECLREVERGTLLTITRHGKRVAALVPASELSLLEQLRAAGPQAGLAGLAGGWKGSEELVDMVTKANRTKPRRAPKLG